MNGSQGSKETGKEGLISHLNCQKKSFRKEGIPSAIFRIDRIDRAIALLVDNADGLCDAMTLDFSHRSRHQSLMADIFGSIESLKSSKKNIKHWMKDEKRSVNFPLNILGAKAKIKYQPKGVVGVIATWNFPVNVPMSALGGIFSAGNRCMLKLSELTPATSSLLSLLISQYFNEDELLGVTGDAEVSAAFASLPFDHMLFVGSANTGKKIMRAAADNLVPVTLELGGKSPVIVGKSVSLKKTALAIVTGKTINAGQICLSPDYVFVPDENLNEFIAELERAFQDLYPTFLDNPDYSSIVNQHHYQRLNNYIEDAKGKNAEVWEINPAKENVKHDHRQKILPTLIINPSDDMKVMQEEIFGPILPIKSYQHIDDVIEYINDRPKPLGLYYFGTNKKEQDYVLNKTLSGGVTINDVLQHASCDDIPFGGVGESGMGCYHGREGFKEFSHARAIYKPARINMMALAGLVPPYTEKSDKMLSKLIKK